MEQYHAEGNPAPVDGWYMLDWVPDRPARLVLTTNEIAGDEEGAPANTPWMLGS